MTAEKTEMEFQELESGYARRRMTAFAQSGRKNRT